MGITKQYFNKQQYYDYVMSVTRHFEENYEVEFDDIEIKRLMSFADALYDECIPEEMIKVEIPQDMPELIEQIHKVVDHYDNQFNFLVTGILMSEMANIQLRNVVKKLRGGD